MSAGLNLSYGINYQVLSANIYARAGIACRYDTCTYGDEKAPHDIDGYKKAINENKKISKHKKTFEEIYNKYKNLCNDITDNPKDIDLLLPLALTNMIEFSYENLRDFLNEGTCKNSIA